MSFEHDLWRGRKGEELFEKATKANGVNMTSVTEDGKYQKNDIDYISSCCGCGWEVKTDYMAYKTGNLALESRTSTQGLSWLWKSRADIFAFVIPQTEELYAIPKLTLLKFCMKEPLRHVHKYDNGKDIELILLPFDKYREAFVPLGVNEEKCA